MKLLNRYWWSNKWWDFKAFLNPRQKWLAKTLPNHWCDKPELIKDLLFNCLKHYVEEEKGLQLDFDWSAELKAGHITQERVNEYAQQNQDLLHAYRYIVDVRPRWEKEMDDAYPPFRGVDNMFIPSETHPGMLEMVPPTDAEKECYKKVTEIEARIDAKDQAVLYTIIKYRQHLWT